MLIIFRKLLLELETGGNVRFEDEQKDEPWVKECEGLVKTFIKRKLASNSPKSVQIHRLSKLHNRNLKLLIETKLGSKMQQQNYSFHLCWKFNQSEMDAFEILEHGFRKDIPLTFSNYMDCTLTEKSSVDIESSKRLDRALIVRVYTDRICDINDGGIFHSNNKKRFA